MVALPRLTLVASLAMSPLLAEILLYFLLYQQLEPVLEPVLAMVTDQLIHSQDKRYFRNIEQH
jgi:hypothetical protein